MTNDEFLKQLDNDFLSAEKKFFSTHEKMLLFNALNGAILMAGLGEGAGVYMEIFFSKEHKYAWLHGQNEPKPAEDRELFSNFIFGERSADAQRQLKQYTGAPNNQTTDGIRIFQLKNRCHTEVDWEVRISVVHPFGMANSIAERLEIAFKDFFLPIPYVYASVA